MNVKIILPLLCFFMLTGCFYKEVSIKEYTIFDIKDLSFEKVRFGEYSIMLPKRFENYGIISLIKGNPNQIKIQTNINPNSVWEIPAFLFEKNPKVEFLEDKIDKPRPNPYDTTFCVQKLIVNDTISWQHYLSYDAMLDNYFLLNDGIYRIRLSFSYELNLTQEETYRILASVRLEGGEIGTDN